MSWQDHRLQSKWPGIALALALLSASTARAEPAGEIALSVTPDAAHCATEAALRPRLARLQVRAGAGDLAVRLDASSEPARLEVLREGVVIATRRFEQLPARCGERLETLAVVIALSIEHALEPPSEPEPAPPSEPEPEPKPAPEPAREPAPAVQPDAEAPAPEAPSHEPSFVTVLSAGGAYGLLPALAGLASIGIELPRGSLRIGLAAVASTETESAIGGGTAQAQLAGARGYGCMHGLAASFDLQACAGLTLGVVLGSGRDYATSQDATGTLLAPLLRLGARFPAYGALSLGVALDGFVHLVRPELQVSGRAGGEATVPALGAAVSLEAALAVP